MCNTIISLPPANAAVCKTDDSASQPTHSGWVRILTTVQNVAETVTQLAPTMKTLVAGITATCVLFGVDDSPFAQAIVGVGAAFNVAGTISGSLVILVRVGEYLTGAINSGVAALLEGSSLVHQHYTYPALQACLERVKILIRICSTSGDPDVLLKMIAESPMLNHLLIMLTI